jgi:heat shock protein HslJ
MQKVRLIALAAILAATSCASDRPRSDQWPTGRKFLSTSVTENGQDVPGLDNGSISLRFTAGRIVADAGCNTLATDGRIDDHRLILGLATMTQIGCPQSMELRDRWLSDFLTSRPTWSLSGDELVLSGPTVRIRLLDRRIADPDRPLLGTRWVVNHTISHEGVSSVPGVEAFLQLDASGGFRGSTGCAPVAGSAAVHANRITFSIAGDPPPACTGPAAMVASAVLGVVRGEVTYRIEARRLTLTDASGAGLELQAD